MKDTYTYTIGDNLYVNLTNRCTNRCSFCVRTQSPRYEGYFLWLEKEPSAEEVIAEINDPRRYREVVFCGYGEPTYRMQEMCKIIAYVHKNGGTTRLNTNGHGNVINGRNIAPLLKEIDGVNISLNAPDSNAYNRVCNPQIEGAFEEVLSFARALKKEKINCWFSVVDCIGKEAVDACKKVADSVQIPLRVRAMIEG